MFTSSTTPQSQSAATPEPNYVAAPRQSLATWKRLALRFIALLVAPACFAPIAVADPIAQQSADDPRIARAWRVLRMVDCARCHGKSYDGLVAPSIVDYVATQGQERFVRMVLDGDLSRGMPGYRSNAYVAESIDDIYRYFVARAKGEIGPDYRAPAPLELE